MLAIHEDGRGRLWTVSPDGVDLVEPDGAVRHFDYGNGRLSGGICDGADGRVVLGSNVGRIVFDPETGSFARNPSVAVPVTTLLVARSGAVWMGTIERGLVIEPVEGSRGDGPRAVGLSGASTVRSLYQDRSGIVWVGTEGGGLDYYDPSATWIPRFTAASPGESGREVRSLFEDRDGVLWVGTARHGLVRIDRQAGTVAKFRPSSTGSVTDFVGPIYEDRTGTLWVSLRNHETALFDRETGRFRTFSNLEGAFTEFMRRRRDGPLAATSGGSSPVFLEDQDGGLWMVVGAGIVRFDPVRGARCDQAIRAEAG